MLRPVAQPIGTSPLPATASTDAPWRARASVSHRAAASPAPMASPPSHGGRYSGAPASRRASSPETARGEADIALKVGAVLGRRTVANSADRQLQLRQY